MGRLGRENHYYPFGMNMEGAWLNNSATRDSRYQYNGKELNDDFGLNWNDYGARWYDASIARFPGVDPIIEKFPFLTPFNYASNNPIANIDLWGLQGTNFNIMNYWHSQGRAMHSQARYQFDETMNSEGMRRYQLFSTGVANTTFGLVGTTSSITAEVGTGGLATAGVAVALTFSLGEVCIGCTQMVDALFGEANAESPLHESQTLLGLTTNVAGFEYAGYVDALAGFAPGTMIGGNFAGFLDDVRDFDNAFKNGEDIGYPILSGLDAYLDIKGVVKGTIELKQQISANGNVTTITPTKQKREEPMQKSKVKTSYNISDIATYIQNLK